MDHLNLYKPRHLRRAAIESISLTNNQHGSRKLIVVQLSGGNDGLNTVIPFRNDQYYRLRPKLGIKPKKKNGLFLDDQYAVHESLEKFKRLYDEGLVSVVNSVGYPNPDRSHFKSMDIWHTASLDPYRQYGWIGRYLDHYGNENDSLAAIELKDVLSLALKGQQVSGISVNDFVSFFKEMNTKTVQEIIHSPVKNIPGNPDLELIYGKLRNSFFSMKPIMDSFSAQSINSEFANDEFGKDCKSVCDMILSGSPTKIYYLSHGSFDTHVSQMGKHKSLLESFSENLYEMVRTLKNYDQFNDVSILVFSEFGRRVAENGSSGTDHGAGNNLFLISDHLAKAGMFNDPPDLFDLLDGDIKFKVDFRSIYADILKNWLGVDSELILKDRFAPINLFKKEDNFYDQVFLS